jgi:hypothetical protein
MYTSKTRVVKTFERSIYQKSLTEIQQMSVPKETFTHLFEDSSQSLKTYKTTGTCPSIRCFDFQD